MLRETSPWVFREWQAYAELEPFDERRADWRAASIVTMLANVNRDSKKKAEPFKLDDFTLKFETTDEASRPKQTIAQQKSLLLAIAAANVRG